MDSSVRGTKKKRKQNTSMFVSMCAVCAKKSSFIN